MFDEESKKLLLNKGDFLINLFGEKVRVDARGELFKKFVVPPFSILDTRSGYWQERKTAWIKGLN